MNVPSAYVFCLSLNWHNLLITLFDQKRLPFGVVYVVSIFAGGAYDAWTTDERDCEDGTSAIETDVYIVCIKLCTPEEMIEFDNLGSHRE
jgi:hypothetical protein